MYNSTHGFAHIFQRSLKGRMAPYTACWIKVNLPQKWDPYSVKLWRDWLHSLVNEWLKYEVLIWSRSSDSNMTTELKIIIKNRLCIHDASPSLFTRYSVVKYTSNFKKRAWNVKHIKSIKLYRITMYNMSDIICQKSDYF